MMWRLVERLYKRRLDKIWRDGYDKGYDKGYDTGWDDQLERELDESAREAVTEQPRPPWATAPQPAMSAAGMLLGIPITPPAPYDPVRAHALTVARFGPDPYDEAERRQAEWRRDIHWWADEAYRAIGADPAGGAR